MKIRRNEWARASVVYHFVLEGSSMGKFLKSILKFASDDFIRSMGVAV
jgi:hypothetical protein